MKLCSALVIFTSDIPDKNYGWWKTHECVISLPIHQKFIEQMGLKWVSLEAYVDAGSIYEANVFAEELSLLKLPDGKRVSRSFTYHGYDLWWLNYDTLFFYFCLPYTQYKKLLEYLKGYESVYVYKPSFHRLFSVYLSNYGIPITIDNGPGLKSLSLLPLGVFFQILLTVLSLPVLILKRCRIMIYTGDEFDKGKDHNFRMKFMYEELRKRKTPFIEFIRSVESWKTVLHHAFVRRRPVVYTDAVAFIGRYMSLLSGGRVRARALFGLHTYANITEKHERLKYAIATQYLLTVYDDVWAIRIMKLILKGIGVKVAFMLVATGRNLQATLGCKLNGIPTVGVLHGVASRHYNLYEFMPAYEGEKVLSVDRYGLWSDWWKEYFIEHSRAYRKDQLFVSGPMRPFDQMESAGIQGTRIRVLFVSELVAVPSEVMPYLWSLIAEHGIELTIKFRPHHDTFEEWLTLHEPQILNMSNVRVVSGGMHEAIQNADVVTGCQSTGVLEALMQNRVPIFFRTQKWGDYYGMTEQEGTHRFFAENPTELIQKIKDAVRVDRSQLEKLCVQYFGDPSRNGSAWAVDQLEEIARQ